MARLAKYWDSSIFYTAYLNGRSSIFEFLGIAAGREEEENNSDNPSILRAFRLFLKRVENIHSQRVIFDDFYKKSDIPQNVLHQTPLLLDPSNPYNNFMHDFESSVQSLFSGYARESSIRLERVERQLQLNHGFPEFRILFLPQPRPIDVGPQIRFRTTNWLVGSRSRERHLQPNLIVRKPALGNDKFVLKFIKKTLSSFLFVADLEASHKVVEKAQLANDQVQVAKDRVQVAKDRVQDVVDDLFLGHKSSWSSTNDSHDNYDVTFEIPIGREGGESLIISSKWDRF